MKKIINILLAVCLAFPCVTAAPGGSVPASAESVVSLTVGDTYTIETGMTLGSDEMLDANWYVTNPSGITAVTISGKTYDTADCTIKAVASSGGQVVTVRVEYQQYLGYPYTDLVTGVSYYKFIVYDEDEVQSDIIGSGTTLDVNWMLTADGVLRVYGEGKMGDYNAQYVPWYSMRESITSVVVESGVTHIGNNNFSGCTSLTSISIPDTVTSIGGAFGDCTAMTDYIVDENNTTYCSVDGVLFDKDMTTLVKYPAARTCSYTVPSSVTTIGASAFSKCAGITDAVIGGGVTAVNAQAFMTCTSLKSVVIGDGVESIGSSAFYGCSALEDVSISDDVTSIGVQGFAYCYALKDVVLPANLTSISNWTFGCCKALESVAVPAGVKSIGAAAFFGYYDIDRQIYYGGSEDDWAAVDIDSNNHGLDTAVIHYNTYDEHKITQEPVTQTIIVGTSTDDETEPTASPTAEATASPVVSDNNCGDNLTWSYAGGVLIISGTGDMYDYTYNNLPAWSDYADKITAVILEDGVTSVGEWAFFTCDAITAVTLPDTLNTVGTYAFVSASSLADVYYSGSESEWNGITINEGNNYLTNANIHYSSQSEDESTSWYIINSLDYEELDGEQMRIDVSLTKDSGDTGTDLVIIAAYDDGMLTGCGLCEISIEAEQSNTASVTLNSGKTIKAFVWSGTSSMIPLSETSVVEISGNDDYIAQGSCGDNVTWTLENSGLLTISGSGAMTDYFGDHLYEPVPWTEYTDKFITSAVIEDGVTSLGGGALYACGNLSTIEIPSSVERIGMLAVSWTSITELVIPEGVKTIEAEAFEGNSALTAVSIPSSITYIGESAFMDCDSLTEVYYAGSQSDWEAISIGDYNESLENAVINYNSSL